MVLKLPKKMWTFKFYDIINSKERKTRTIAKDYQSVLFNVALLIRNIPSNKTRSLQEANWKVCQEFVQKIFTILLIRIWREVEWGWVSSSTILSRNFYCQIRNGNRPILSFHFMFRKCYVIGTICFVQNDRNLSSRSTYYNLIHMQKWKK